jgi:selenocysteine lyase/cysteine desulfurase
VGLEQSCWASLPHKFEAGTPPITEVIGLGAAVDYLQQFSPDEIHSHILSLSRAALATFKRDFPDFRVFAEDREDWVGIISFHHQHIHAHDIAAIQDSHQVCVRAGHHCAQPLMQYLKLDATCRLSPYLYNNSDDIKQFFTALAQARQLF